MAYLMSENENTLWGPGTGTVQFTQGRGLQLCTGMGCASCGGKCGMGIFDSSDWGIAEWGLIGLGAFALFSMFTTAKRGASAARDTYEGAKKSLKRRRRRRARARKAAMVTP